MNILQYSLKQINNYFRSFHNSLVCLKLKFVFISGIARLQNIAMKPVIKLARSVKNTKIYFFFISLSTELGLIQITDA